MLEKTEVCISGVSRVDCVIVDAINSAGPDEDSLSDYYYLHTEMKRLLEYLCGDLRRSKIFLCKS